MTETGLNNLVKMRTLHIEHYVLVLQRLTKIGIFIRNREKLGDVQPRTAIAIYLQRRDGIPVERTLSHSNYHLDLQLIAEDGARPPSGPGNIYEKDPDFNLAGMYLKAQLDLTAEIYGDYIGDKFYDNNVYGREALVLRAIERFSYHPGDATALSSRVLHFTLQSELPNWKYAEAYEQVLKLPVHIQKIIDSYG